MMKTFAMLAAVSMLAASCQTGGVDATIQSNLPRTCALIETSHLAFTVLAAAGQVSKRTARAELAAYTSTRTICANPETATATDALVTAATAYATISSALATERKRKK